MNAIKSTASHNKLKLLLHVCCACCATEVYNRLKNDYEVTLFWYNPNIYPFSEYKSRFNSFVQLVSDLKCNYFVCHPREGGDPLIVDSHLHGNDGVARIELYKIENRKWQTAIAGLENEPEGGRRCEQCYKYRLEKTAEIAKELGFNIFTATLTISPHKNAELINEIGKNIAVRICHSREGGNLLLVPASPVGGDPHLHGDDRNVQFLVADFKKQDGFKKSIELSHKHNLYRQNYCGCKYSIHKQSYS